MTSMRRRDFLRRSLCATAGSAAFGSLLGKLSLANAAMPRTLLAKGVDYRAMVCIYLYGGNDSFNMVVPRHAGGGAPPAGSPYGIYAGTRGSLAVPNAQLLALNPTVAPLGGGEFGLHPSMTGTQQMFNAGRAAIVANVGPLVRPVNKASYELPGTPLPPQLFSHSDQSVLWQTPRADSVTRTGWGGRLADIFASDNGNPALSMNISLDGENVFQAGVSVSPYFMSAGGVEDIDFIATETPGCEGEAWSNARRCSTFNAMMNREYAHPFERAYAQKVRSTMAATEQVATALLAIPVNDAVFRPFWDAFGLPWDPDNLAELPYLAAQLLMIARVIRVRAALGMTRQLFFAGIGGFDTHDAQLEQQPGLLRDLSQAVKAFYDVLDAPAFGLGNSVTTFTASEFGRTLTNNGDGTDHGWGGHHLVFGGGVDGGRIYGRMPDLRPPESNPDDAGWGQIIPTLSADQYAATLATWFGLSGADRSDIFPNLEFMEGPLLSIEGPDLGFMTPG
ncbi:DUF1501 domain-containing protein [Chiayiivirga flava]|uniref:Uncharacterized protein (DUF1501 family) n=1 Tax=Chiayiivirga flava TaxID=659595 RepID=A0A7W8FYE9_9GAMM|nr:DUF1501 domain-containing protein [Chiayiivirga flava]MBB5207036.1 uncharacterized protein (DUF1501 family) [Chiayiivirga flava]